MKYIRFNDSIIDTALFLQLQDLSTVLSGIPELEFEYNYGSFLDSVNSKVTASHFLGKRQPRGKGCRIENGCTSQDDWDPSSFEREGFTVLSGKSSRKAGFQSFRQSCLPYLKMYDLKN